MFSKALATCVALLSVSLSYAAIGDDYIAEAPATIYESEVMSPQNMDFDKENNMFHAHEGWYNDQSIHYYKFRIYAPSTYPNVIAPGASGADIPTQKVYLVTTTGGFDGVIGSPVIQFHTADGNSYSDFMEIVFVKRGANHTANTLKSEGDILFSGATLNETGIMVNLPVVPTGATLQDPAEKGTTKAPIDPIPVWYKGVEVHTYIFEVTSQAAADYFAFTRPVDPTDFAYAIPVKPSFATKDFILAIPIWHVNQYSTGVVTGENSGGPSPTGMRNIINQDRGDPGYSPLWQVYWITALPINYKPDDATNARDMTAENGFDQFIAPMFVNCPDIGTVGELKTPNGADMEFQTKVDPLLDSNLVMGSHSSIIFQGGIPVIFETPDGDFIATTNTTMMGTYEYDLPSADLPPGIDHFDVIANEQFIRAIDLDLTGEDAMEEGDIVEATEDAQGSPPSSGFGFTFRASLLIVLFMSYIVL